ncbi:site-specific integrase [Flectobacillus major]|uniref:site-specific integrase n=1 Tax=Flectobacillus major TaxID=103 RepID=UPI0003F82D2E|nr:site-specific integrase [Flectobacillus major]
MANAFYRLRTTSAKTPQLIYVGCRFGKDQLIMSTGVKVLPKHWDFEKTKVKNVTTVINKDEINVFLHDLKVFINSTIEKYKLMREPLTKQSLKEEIEDYLNPKPAEVSETLFNYIEKFILEAENGKRLVDNVKRYNQGTIKRFRTTQTLLIDFSVVYSKPVDFDTIDLEFYKEYSLYMVNVKDYKTDTIAKHVRTLKTFLREATEEGINTNLDYQKKAFKVVLKSNEESTSIALNESELLEMCNLDLSETPKLERVRDLFIIGANTGLRFSDFTSIKPENIRKDYDGEFIEIIQYKTKRKVIVPINQTVKTILYKYNNELPKAISNQKFNDYIKEVAKLCQSLHSLEFLSYVKGGKDVKESVERWKMVSSHTARRSFASNAYERGTPVNAIMAITDHKTEKSFLLYIKTSKRKQAEIFRGYQK